MCRVRKNIISKLQIRLESKFLLEYRSEVAENEVPSQILDYLELGRKRVKRGRLFKFLNRGHSFCEPGYAVVLRCKPYLG